MAALLAIASDASGHEPDPRVPLIMHNPDGKVAGLIPGSPARPSVVRAARGYARSRGREFVTARRTLRDGDGRENRTGEISSTSSGARVRARPRMVISLIFGALVLYFSPSDVGTTRAMLGWNAGVLLFLVLILTMMARTDAVKKSATTRLPRGRALYCPHRSLSLRRRWRRSRSPSKFSPTKDLQVTSRALRLALTFLTVIIDLGLRAYYFHDLLRAPISHAEIKDNKRGKKENQGGPIFPAKKFPVYFHFLYFALHHRHDGADFRRRDLFAPDAAARHRARHCGRSCSRRP